MMNTARQSKNIFLKNEDTLVLQGDINFNTVTPVFTQLNSLLSSRIKILDCSGITHVDSSAISLIIYSVALAEARSTALTLRGLNDSISSLIRLYGVNDFLAVEHSPNG